VCTCVRVYVCTCVRVYVCTCVRVYVCTCVRVYVCTCVRLYVCTCVRVYVCTCVRVYVCTRVRVYVCMRVRVYVCVAPQDCRLRAFNGLPQCEEEGCLSSTMKPNASSVCALTQKERAMQAVSFTPCIDDGGGATKVPSALETTDVTAAYA